MSRYIISVAGKQFQVEFKGRVGALMNFAVNGQEYQVEVATDSDLSKRGTANRSSKAQRQAKVTDLRAPMPGIVSEVLATQGLEVQTGDVLVVIEAMKMENPIRAPHDGVVDQVLIQKGQEVSAGAVLVRWR
jgi:biotin carboxyl carrier protein